MPEIMGRCVGLGRHRSASGVSSLRSWQACAKYGGASCPLSCNSLNVCFDGFLPVMTHGQCDESGGTCRVGIGHTC